MAAIEDLLAQKAALEQRRTSGIASSSPDGAVTFKSDAEMKNALADLNRQIAEASGKPAVRMIRVSSSKGL